MTQFLLPGPQPETETTAEVGLEPKKFRVDARLLPECEQLLTMLTYRRPERSRSEGKFIRRFLIPLKLLVDQYGNYYKRIGTDPILWSCHTDTVHDEKGMLAVGFDGDEVGISDKDKSNCLGADDTAGIWLMVQMIKANKPGLYIFHRDEEHGRKGSQFISKSMTKQLKGIKFAVALDRKGQDSVITHQMGQRCCSTDFAKSMIDGLGLGFKEDDTGSYTDTASYVDLIPECTNLSVGYTGAHTRFERLNLAFIFRLRKALLALDVTKLVEKRKPGEKEYKSYSYQGNNRTWGGDGGMGGWAGDGGDMGWGTTYFNGRMAGKPSQHSAYYDDASKKAEATTTNAIRISGHENANGAAFADKFARGFVDVYGCPLQHRAGTGSTPAAVEPELEEDEVTDVAKDFEAMVRLVKGNPEAVADILEQYGMGFKEVQEEILSMYGVVNI